MTSFDSSRPARWALLLFGLVAAWGCASEVIPNYGDPAEVVGGVGAGPTTGNGGSGGATTTSKCDIDTDCGGVSYAADIFPILNKGGGMKSCSKTDGSPIDCHSESQGMLKLTPGDAAGHRTALLSYVLDSPEGKGAYIVPCDPEGSKIICNLIVSDGANPSPPCGKPMPYAKASAPTMAEIQLIKDWIACGAPDN